MTVRTLAALAAALILAAPAQAKPRADRPARGDRSASPKPKSKAPAAPPTCKEPDAVDPSLKAGLAAYAKGDWRDAATKLQAWANTPGADSDPAAARGYYALSYAARTARIGDSGSAALAAASRLLEVAVASRPTLEAWYYLQAVRLLMGNQAGELEAVSTAIKAVEDGSLCPVRDGDDAFRLSRLYKIAGNAAKASEALSAAGAAFASMPADAPSPYRALAERELGEAALTSNDLENAETHLALAAKLDPRQPGVHRQLGIVYLRRGKVAEAAEHWRTTWQLEGEAGNMFLYALPIMNKVIAYRARPDMERVTGLTAYTTPALEQAALQEAKTMLGLRAESDEAKTSNAPFPEEKTKEMDRADYRMNELLLEYIARGEDVQELALQNGLLPAIHGHGLPAR